MSEAALAELAACIRDFLRDHPDRGLVRKYSFVAARLEQLRLGMHDGRNTPDDDARFRELGEMLRTLSKALGFSGDLPNGFLPKDPGRILSDSWLENARLWLG